MIARKLNRRPRETLEFATPAEILDAGVASTGRAGTVLPELDVSLAGHPLL